MTVPRFSRPLVSLAALLALSAWPLGAQTLADPDAAVRELFQKRCADCHSPAGDDESPTLSRATDLLKLRTDPGYITVGSAENSPLFKRVTLAAGDKKRMPKSTADDPREPLTADELAVLRRWIEPTDAPKRTFVTEQAVAETVHRDLSAADADDARYYRYLTLHNLANAGDSDAALESYRGALAKLLNSLSWERRIVRPVPVDPARLVFRFDLRAYGWTPAKWERLAGGYPYAIVLGKRIETESALRAGTEVPFLRGDWFAFAASQPPLYDELLGLPPTDRELEREVLHVDVADNLRRASAQRAGFVKSGVSEFNRLIERHPTAFGAYWKSYDFASNDGKQDLLLNPLGPTGVSARFAFAHDGGELIWNLPNGLQAYRLSTAAGVRLERAPTEIVRDPSRRDAAIINGISCIGCHAAGMRMAPKGSLADEVRPAATALDLSAAEGALLARLYPEPAAFAALHAADERRFLAALAETGATENPEPVLVLYNRFKQDITLATVGAEFGVERNDLQQRMEESSIQALRSFGQRLRTASAFSRKSFIEQFRLTVTGLHLGTPREFTPILHEDFFPNKKKKPDGGENPTAALPDGDRARLLTAGVEALQSIVAPGAFKGADGTPGRNGQIGGAGTDGRNGVHKGRPYDLRKGGHGGPGGDGTNGGAGGNGGDAPALFVRVEEIRFATQPSVAFLIILDEAGEARARAVWDVSKPISLDARGGNGGGGGHGGPGGRGGLGGFGGDGDPDRTPNYGGDGGNGGAGGNGGNGSNGGAGGSGSSVRVKIVGSPAFAAAVKQNLRFNLGGGAAGPRGLAGGAGAGGEALHETNYSSPYLQGGQGKPGAPGSNGAPGFEGVAGAPGTVTFE